VSPLVVTKLTFISYLFILSLKSIFKTRDATAVVNLFAPRMHLPPCFTLISVGKLILNYARFELR